MRNWKVRLEFKIEDLWIGVFWRSRFSLGPMRNREGIHGCEMERSSYDLWICVLPCLPIHVNWTADWAYSH